MPSPLSGLTHAAASPISAQLRPGDVDDRAAHREQRGRRHPQLAGELELLAALLRVVRHQRLDREVGRPLAVARVPTPRFTSPVPSGKIQP